MDSESLTCESCFPDDAWKSFLVLFAFEITPPKNNFYISQIITCMSLRLESSLKFNTRNKVHARAQLSLQRVLVSFAAASPQRCHLCTSEREKAMKTWFHMCRDRGMKTLSHAAVATLYN